MNTAEEIDMIKECRSCIFIQCYVLNILVFTLPDYGWWAPKHAGPIKKLYVKMLVFLKKRRVVIVLNEKYNIKSYKLY
jgi:hypothetical protein